jgi:hypothetical protein
MSDLAEMVDAAQPKPGKRGPYNNPDYRQLTKCDMSGPVPYSIFLLLPIPKHPHYGRPFAAARKTKFAPQSNIRHEFDLIIETRAKSPKDPALRLLRSYRQPCPPDLRISAMWHFTGRRQLIVTH